MSANTLQVDRGGQVAIIWLNRPEVHNAFDGALVADLTESFQQLSTAPDVRVIILAARGKSFSAGAQAQWMQEQGRATQEQNYADAQRLAQLFHVIATCPKPTIARVQGGAYGGGVGLIAACDYALASSAGGFCISEVRLGLIPAVISPYVLRAIGARNASRYFLTAERFDAQTALNMGLLHEVVQPPHLDDRLQEITSALLAGAPAAQAEAKQLIAAVANQRITPELLDDTAQRIAKRRAHPEAAEGLAAFLAKRPANWVPPA